jgi:hypothetical protein
MVGCKEILWKRFLNTTNRYWRTNRCPRKGIHGSKPHRKYAVPVGMDSPAEIFNTGKSLFQLIKERKGLH